MLFSLFSAACQIDLKRIIAYGSVSHMAFVTLCIFLGNLGGLESAVLMMLGHGFVSSSLFLLIGILYERGHTRNIRYYAGLYKIAGFGFYFLFFILCDIGIPFSPSFISEFIGFMAIIQVSIFLAVFVSFPIILGVVISLILAARVLFGLNDSRYFTNKPRILNNFLYDKDRTEFLKVLDCKVLRVKNLELENSLKKVLLQIKQFTPLLIKERGNSGTKACLQFV
jgi:NADH:ubiquinone oxidoreductase subunit 4 (subunit M)